MDRHHDVATGGNVVQMARTNLDGKNHREMTLALGFGADRDEAVDTARASLERGFDRRRARICRAAGTTTSAS